MGSYLMQGDHFALTQLHYALPYADGDVYRYLLARNS